MAAADAPIASSGRSGYAKQEAGPVHGKRRHRDLHEPAVPDVLRNDVRSFLQRPPITNVTTAHGDKRQPGGRCFSSRRARASSSSARACSAWARRICASRWRVRPSSSGDGATDGSHRLGDRREQVAGIASRLDESVPEPFAVLLARGVSELGQGIMADELGFDVGPLPLLLGVFGHLSRGRFGYAALDLRLGDRHFGAGRQVDETGGDVRAGAPSAGPPTPGLNSANG